MEYDLASFLQSLTLLGFSPIVAAGLWGYLSRILLYGIWYVPVYCPLGSCRPAACQHSFT